MNIINKLNTLASRSEKQRCLAVLMFLAPFALENPLPMEILDIVEPEIETVTGDPIFHRGSLPLSGINLSKLELVHFDGKDIRNEKGQLIKIEGGREICLKSDALLKMRYLVSVKNELISFQNKIVEQDKGINLEFSHWVNLAQRALSVYLHTHLTLDRAIKANIAALVREIRYQKVECRLETNFDNLRDNQFMANLYSINRFPEQVNGLYERLRDLLRQKIANRVDPGDLTYQLALTEKELQNYPQAIKHLQSCIPPADNWDLGGDERIGDLYLKIAEIYELSENQVMAISYYNDALEEYVRSRGEIDPKSAIAIHRILRFTFFQNLPFSARKTQQRLLQAHEGFAKSPDKSIEQATNSAYLGILYSSEGKSEEGLKWKLDSLNVFTQTLQDNPVSEDIRTIIDFCLSYVLIVSNKMNSNQILDMVRTRCIRERMASLWERFVKQIEATDNADVM
jgi:hypothetical protein